MSDGERLLLEKLRKGPLKDLSEEQYAIIQKETEANGIRGLKGSSAQLVFNAIRKIKKTVAKDSSNHNDASIAIGDMVGWNSSGGHAMGRVEQIKRNGVINVPDSKFTIEGTPDDPAVLIRIYRNGEKTETLVGHKMSTLNKGFSKHLTVEKYNSNHDNIGRFSSGEGTGVAVNGDNNMAAMDLMDVKHPPRTKRKLTASEQKILNRITSPATNYVSRPGDNRRVFQRPFTAGPRLQGGVTGYVPFSGPAKQ